MTEEFKTEAFRYLLGELDAEGRAVFEGLLAHDPALRAMLKACADDVARFACETATAEAVPPVAQRTVLANVLTVALQEPRKLPPSKRAPWKYYAWAVAASVALGFGLFQLFRPTVDVTRNSSSTTATNPRRPLSLLPRPRDLTDTDTPANEDQPRAQTVKRPDLGIAEEMRRLEKLRSEYADLERARDALRKEYENILRQLALIGRDMGRLTAIELVDAGSYSRGERKGLVDIARTVLTEPGIVAVTPITPSTPAPTPETPDTPTPEPNHGPVSTGHPSITGTNPDSNNTTTPPTTQSGEQTQTTTTGKDLPYAWSVYDETSARGYLNLYNLPAATTDQSLQLWVKQTGSDSYQNVGTVPPQYYGGSGSLYYSVPGMTQAPAEILITEEPRDKTPTQPTGTTVLRGP